jgi:hypothetical protein
MTEPRVSTVDNRLAATLNVRHGLGLVGVDASEQWSKLR